MCWYGLGLETVHAGTFDYDEMVAEYDREPASGISDDEYYDSDVAAEMEYDENGDESADEAEYDPDEDE